MSRYTNYLTDVWYALYTKNGLCSLCGNSGTIDTRGIQSTAGIPCGDLHLCICPNGQAIREQKPLLPQVPSHSAVVTPDRIRAALCDALIVYEEDGRYETAALPGDITDRVNTAIELITGRPIDE